MSKILLIVLGLIILVGGGYLAISTFLQNSQDPNTKPITLTVWGVKDDEQIMNNVAIGFKKLHPNVTINYVSQNPLNYRTRVQTQIGANQGPDVLALHNSWLPMF